MRRRWLLPGFAAGLLLTAGSITLAATSDREGGPSASFILVAITAGFAFVVSGLIALWRRPENRTGLLMSGVGFTWFLNALTVADSEWVFAVGFVFSGLAFGAFVHLMLAFPAGYLGGRLDRWLVGLTYALAMVPQLLTLLVDTSPIPDCDDCPGSPIIAWESDRAAGVIQVVAALAVFALLSVILGHVVQRYRQASTPLRRVLGPVLLSSGLAIVSIVAVIVVETFVGGDEAMVVSWVVVVAFTAVPVAFLLGVLRSRLARAAAGDLLLELSNGVPLRHALSRALHDPTLDIAYYLPEEERYVNSEGRSVQDGAGDRVAKFVERDGRPIAALLHDPLLLDEPELVDSVAAAAALWLENERLQAELRAQVNYLLTVVHATPSLLVAVDTEGRIQNFNRAVEVASGIDDPEQIRGRLFWEVFFDAEGRDRMRERFEAAAPDFEPAEHEQEFTNPRGEHHVIAWKTAPMRGEDGLVSRVIAGGTDITERKIQERELRAKEERLRAAIESSPVGIIEVDLEGRVRTWNPAAEQMFGWTAEELSHGRVYLVPDEEREVFEEVIARVHAGETVTGLETVRKRKDGTLVDVEVSSAPIRDTAGAVVGHLSTFVDITDRKRQERELRAGEERLRAVIESSPVAIVEVGLDSRFTRWNPAAEQIFGWTDEEALSGPLPMVPEDRLDEYAERVARVRSGHSYTGLETVRRRKDGTLVDVAVAAAPIRESGGAVVGHMVLYVDIAERKRREHELQSSEERRRAVIEASPVAIVEVGLGGRIRQWNTAAEQMFGWTAEEATTGDFQLVPNARKEEYLALLAQVEAGEAYTGHESQRLRKDGSLVDVEVSSAPIRDSSGAFVGHMALFVDITDRKERERALRESEERLRAAIEASPVAIVEMSNDDLVMRWNPAAERIFGWTADEVVGRPIPIVPPDYRDEVEELVLKITEGQVYTGFETVRRRKDGALIDVEISAAPLRDQAGVVAGRMAVFLDITERKERETALRESGERLRAAIEASPVAILEMSLGDRVVSWNPAAERMFGWTEAEVVGKTLPIVPPGGEAGALSLNVRVEAGEVISGFEAKRRRKDGKDLDVEISAAPLYDSSGEVIGGMALYVDVSDRKQRELALRASEERLRAAIEASPVAIVELSVDNRVLMWNPAAERMFGWAPDEVVGEPLPIIPDELRREYESLVGRVRAGHVLAAHETIRHTKDGTPLDVEISSAPIQGSGGEIVSYMSVYVDVTERKRRELEVQRERDFLDILADAVPSFLVVVDTEGRLAGDAVNRAYTETFQWTADEVEGRSFFDLMAPDDGYNARMAVAAAANGVARTDLEGGWLCRDGKVRTVAWTATPLLEARDIPLVLITGADVTERVRQESEIRASRQRIVEAGDKARHRLERDLHDGAQQRLVALSITLRLAEAKLAEDAEGAQQLLAASRDELSRAIDELRELARGIHPAVLTDRGLEAALEALTAKVPLPVELTLPGERLPAPVEAAAYYLIAEALTNVTKYASASSARVAVTRLDGTLTVEVADDGIGGADPAAGSGLRGLADRVAALDGTLVVESPKGKGTCVRAEIPVREPALSK